MSRRTKTYPKPWEIPGRPLVNRPGPMVPAEAPRPNPRE